MNEHVHLNCDDHLKFCEIFLSNKNHSISNPKITSQESLNDSQENDSSSLVQSSPVRVSLPSDANSSPKSKLLKLKKHMIKALENKKNSSPMSKGTTLFSESRKRKLSEFKVFSDIKNLPPVLNNNIKMFINKLKRIGYVNNLSVLKPYDLKIINDHAYYEPELEIESFNFRKRFKDCHGFLASKLEIFGVPFGIKKLTMPVIHPYSKFKLFWDLLISILTIFLLFYIPLSLSFGVHFLNESDMKLLVSSILIIDMVLEMNTLYFHHGLEVQNRAMILRNYLKSYFIPDLIALFSNLIEIKDFSYVDSYVENAFSLLFYMKIFSLMKFSNKMMNRFQLSHERKGVKRLLLLFFVIILITHISACGWYYVGIHGGTSETSWIKVQRLENQDWSVQYMSSFYWSIVTVMTVGYGDITPQNDTERTYCLFVILFGGMMFPYSINSIGMIIQDIQRDQKRFDDTLDIINAYMKRKNVNPTLQTRIREYLNFIWREEKSQNMEEEKKIINSLSHSLKEELNLEAYGFFLKNNPLFTNFFSEHSLKKLVNVMKEIFVTPDDVIFLQNQKDENPAIYFIGKGNVKVYSEQTNKVPILLKELKEGDYFGERSFFTSLKQENTAISNKFTTLFMITLEDFIEAIRENKNDYENFVMIKEKLIFYNDYTSINKKCFSCNQFNHIIEECPKLHFVPNIEKIIKKFNYPIPNERILFVRSKKRSSNARRIICKTVKGYQNFKIRLKTMLNKAVIKEEDEFSEDESKSSKNDDELVVVEDLEEVKTNPDSFRKELYQHSLSKTLNEKTLHLSAGTKSLKSLNDDNMEPERIYPNNENKVSLKDFTDSPINFKNSISVKSNTKSNDKKNNDPGNNNKKFEKNPKQSSTLNVDNKTLTAYDEVQIDKVYNFKNYFPNFNIEEIIKNFSRISLNEKDIIRKYVKKKYRNLTHYTFFTNIILEKFLEEAKIRRKNRKSILMRKNTKETKDTLINMRKSVYPVNLASLNPLKKKNYFSKNEQNKQEIKSFADLINTLVQKNRKSKLDNKI